MRQKNAFKTASTLGPGHGGATYELGLWLLNVEKTPESSKQGWKYMKAAAEEFKVPDAISFLFVHYFGSGDLQEAERVARLGVENSDWPDFQWSLGILLESKGQTEVAEKWIAKSLESKAGAYRERLETQAVRLKKKGDLRQAARLADLSSLLGNRYASVLLGEIYALDRDQERAQLVWERAYQSYLSLIESGNADSRDYISAAFLSAYLGREFEGEEWLERAEYKLMRENNLPVLALHRNLEIWSAWVILRNTDQAELAYEKVQKLLNQIIDNNPSFLFRTLRRLAVDLKYKDILTNKSEVVEQLERTFARYLQ